MRRVAAATGAKVQTTVSKLQPGVLGTCAKFEEAQARGPRPGRPRSPWRLSRHVKRTGRQPGARPAAESAGSARQRGMVYGCHVLALGLLPGGQTAPAAAPAAPRSVSGPDAPSPGAPAALTLILTRWARQRP